MNPNRTTKRGHTDLLYWILGNRRKYLHLCYCCLCKLYWPTVTKFTS